MVIEPQPRKAWPTPPALPPLFGDVELEEARWLLGRALSEDLPLGDLTTDPLFSESGPGGRRAHVQAAFVPRSPGVLCGVPVVRELFRMLDGKGDSAKGREILLEEKRQDGDRLEAGAPFLLATGPAASVLRMERIALNFLERLSGISTHTRRWVDELSGTGVRLLDTRKTTPGWRHLEKYAVRAGGGENHRNSLSDAVLLKDNHAGVLRCLGRKEVRQWVMALKRSTPRAFFEVEVDSREELVSALEAEVDSILLDNFSTADLRWAVETRNRRFSARGNGPLLEASGGIRLESVREIAATGVERISVGALTHSSAALDIGLDLVRAWEHGV